MAIVNVVVDTDKETMTVNVDGEDIPNPSSFSAYSMMSYDGMEVSFSVSTRESNGDVTKYVSISGSQDKPVKTDSEKIRKDILSAFKV